MALKCKPCHRTTYQGIGQCPSYEEGVKWIKAEHGEMNYKNPSDMTKEELDRITFTIIKGHATYSIDETNSIIEI